MQGLQQLLLTQFRAMSVLEVIAVLAAMAYLLLAIRQNIFCWLFAACSSGIYVWLYFDASLYMESGLNVFYFAMAAYGWYVWYFERAADKAELPVSRWPLAVHGKALGLIAVLSAGSGYLLHRYTDAAFPYVDSLTTWAAIWATFLVARKVLENWWYWLFIDSASVLIFWTRDLQLTALLFVAYTVMIPFGYLSWRRSLRERTL